jgi:hypothetical protein
MGLVLLATALVAGQMGEGSIVPLAISGSPISVLLVDDILAVPIVWLVVAILIATEQSATAAVWMVAQYVAAPWAVTRNLYGHGWNREFEQLRTISLPLVLPWVACYAASHVIAWRLILRLPVWTVGVSEQSRNGETRS